MIRQPRQNAGLTQEKLAELVDQWKEAVSNIERGVSLLGLDIIQTICDAAKVPMTSIVDDTTENTNTADLRARLNAIFPHLPDQNKKILEAIATRVLEQT